MQPLWGDSAALAVLLLLALFVAALTHHYWKEVLVESFAMTLTVAHTGH